MNIPSKSGLAVLAAALIAATSGAQADSRYGNETVARAKVIASTPIYETVNEPRTECWTETVGYQTQSYPSANNTGGAIVGAIAGGLLGSTIGKGSGQVAAAAVGAATGAVIGDRWPGGRVVSGPQQVERCQTSDNFRQILSAYDVRYRFQGQVYSIRLPYDPGDFLNLRVSFSVAEDQRSKGWKSGYNTWGDR
jgi:uncharacterized protein YcfJ